MCTATGSWGGGKPSVAMSYIAAIITDIWLHVLTCETKNIAQERRDLCGIQYPEGGGLPKEDASERKGVVPMHSRLYEE